MKRVYFCPFCNATLNPSVKVILTAIKNERGGMILLSPQPGNYEVIAAQELDLRPGDVLDLHCPVCSKSLVSRINEKLAEIGFRLTNGMDGRAHFSRRVGEHATFFITSEEVRSYGEDADQYSSLNSFGAGEVETSRTT
jgi:hypothetical protein